MVGFTQDQIEGREMILELKTNKFGSLHKIGKVEKDIIDLLKMDGECSYIRDLQSCFSAVASINDDISKAGRCFTDRISLGPIKAFKRTCTQYDVEALENTAGSFRALAQAIDCLPLSNELIDMGRDWQISLKDFKKSLEVDAKTIETTLRDPKVVSYLDVVRNLGRTYLANDVARNSSECTSPAR